MLLTKKDLENLPRIKRLNLVNALTGIKPANLIGTRSQDGLTNLAIFSSVLHLGSNPALLGLIVRPASEVRRHTYENIRATGSYTINFVPLQLTAAAHFTSAKFEEGVSEFGACGFTELYNDGVLAPFVKESRLKIGMQFLQEIPIEANGTIMIIGTVEQILLPEKALDEEGYLDLEMLEAVGVSGLNSYYSVRKKAQYGYARPGQWPKENLHEEESID